MPDHEYITTVKKLSAGVKRLTDQLRAECCFEACEWGVPGNGVMLWTGTDFWLRRNGDTVKLPSSLKATAMSTLLATSAEVVADCRAARDEVVDLAGPALAALELVVPTPSTPPPSQVADPAETVTPR